MNRASRPSATSSRQSWRQRSGSRPSPKSRSAARWLTTLLGLLLLVALLITIYQLLQGSRQTYLGTIAVTEYDPVVVPPLSYVSADAAALQQLERDNLQQQRPNDWKMLQESGSMGGLAERLRAFGADERDTVVIYVSAHGVSDTGKPYVLGSDYLRNNAGAEEGRYALDALLAQFDQTEAGLKLLVLDCGRLGYDSRLGATPNDFPRLVEQAVAESADPALWVLLPNSPQQTTAVSNGLRRSLFSHAFTAALQGAANRAPAGNDDLYLTLDELYRYLWNQSRTWSGDDPSSGPTPRLLRGGQGEVAYQAIPPDLHVLEYSTHDKRADNSAAELSKGEAADQEQSSPEKRANGVKKKSMRPAAKQDGKQVRGRFEAAGSSMMALLQPETAQATRNDGQPPPSGADAPPASADAPAVSPQADSSPAAAAASGAPPTSQPAAAAAPSPSQPPAQRLPEPVAAAEPEALPFDVKGLDRQTQQLLRALHYAWEARDRLRDRTYRGDSPVDFAPHLWREIDAILLDYEYRCRDTADPDAIISQLRLMAGYLEELHEAIEQESTFRTRDTRQVFRKLANTWETYRQDPRREKFNTSELEAAGRAARAARDALYDAVYLVRWQQRLAFTLQRVSHQQLVSSFLSRAVELQRLLSELEGGYLTEDYRHRLEDAVERLELARRALVQEMQLTASAASRRLQSVSDERQLEDLLSTPLLTAQQRLPLLARLLQQDAIPGGALEEYRAPQPIETAQIPWRPLTDLMKLETELIRLVDPGLADSLDTLLFRPPADQEGWFKLEQAVGQRLEAFYTGLPGAIALQLDEASDRASRLLVLVDARDAPRVTYDSSLGLDLGVLPLPPAPELTLQLSPTDVTASPEQWQPTHVQLAVSAMEASTAFVSFHFDERLLRVRHDQREVHSGQRLEVPLQEEQATSLSVELRGQRFWQKEDDPGPKDLIVRAEAGEQQVAERISYELPLPNQVDLVIKRIGSSQEFPDFQGGLRLRPFPNRATSFQFSLLNRSGEDKEVKVELIAVPRLPGASFAPGILFDGNRKVYSLARDALLVERNGQVQLQPGVSSLVSVDALKVPAGRLVDIDFTAKKESAPAQPGSDTAAAPPAETPQPAADVSYGLLCLLTNMADPAQQWVKWIELDPLEPKHYLSEEVRYEGTTGQVVVDLTLRNDIDGDGQPDKVPGLEESPIAAQLQLVSGENPPGAAKVFANIQPPKISDRLFLAVPADGRHWEVSVDVDGYPRAFMYEIPARLGSSAKDIRQNQANVRFRWLQPILSQRELEARGLKEQQPPLEIEGANRQVSVRPCQQLLVAMDVDAPENAFLTHEADEYIGLALVGQDGSQHFERFYADRQVTTKLLQTGERGLVVLESTVGDYQVPLDVRGFINTVVSLEGQVIVRRGQQLAPEDRVQIAFDATPPQVMDLQLDPPRAYVGTFVTAHVEAEDEHSRIVETRVGIDKDLNQKLDDNDILGVWMDGVIKLDTKDLLPNRRYPVLASVVDEVGWVSMPVQEQLAMFEPPKPTEKAAAPQKGVVTGVVLFEGRAPAREGRVTVTLAGSGKPPQEVQAGGRFRFDDVLLNRNFTLTAEGTHGNRFCKSEPLEVQASPKDQPVQLRVTVK